LETFEQNSQSIEQIIEKCFIITGLRISFWTYFNILHINFLKNWQNCCTVVYTVPGAVRFLFVCRFLLYAFHPDLIFVLFSRAYFAHISSINFQSVFIKSLSVTSQKRRRKIDLNFVLQPAQTILYILADTSALRRQ